jgi:hypothetical protein
MKLRGILKRHIAPRTLLRSGSRQFGTSTYPPVKKSWISDVARVFFAKK